MIGSEVKNVKILPNLDESNELTLLADQDRVGWAVDLEANIIISRTYECSMQNESPKAGNKCLNGIWRRGNAHGKVE